MRKLLVKTILISIVFLALCQIDANAGNANSDKDIAEANARGIEQKIRDSYSSSDFSTTVKLLETQISQMRERLSKGEKINSQDVFKKQLLLAYLCAWKLNNTDRALVEYQRLADLRTASTELNKYPPIENLYIGEIHEMRKEFSKALEYYQECINATISLQEKEQDDFSMMIGDELIKLVKYRIDSVKLKYEREFKPLLGKLKPVTNPAYLSIWQMLTLVLVPTAEYDMTNAMKSDLPAYIKQSPSNFASETMNFMLALSASASTIDETSEKAMNFYLSKYPDSYYSLILGSAFYKYYKENGMPEKEKPLLKELQNIAKKRKVELVLDPDSRFSSPEKTFEIYKKALTEGDFETIEECYGLGRGYKMTQMFKAIGKDKTKEIGVEIGPMQKITGDEQTAKYRILRNEKGQDITYYINFHNIDGEWKMEEF